MTPYTHEELARETVYTVTAYVADRGWFTFKTTTAFLCNGLLKQLEARINEGTPCAEPSTGFVRVTGSPITRIIYPVCN